LVVSPGHQRVKPSPFDRQHRRTKYV
jgi:hypothetical protein